MRTSAADGTELFYDVTGAGPALLLVHGITESSATWGDLVADLAKDHTVVTMDLRGHGQSGDSDAYDLAAMAGDVGAVLVAAGSTDVVLIGHSLGGAVVSAYAAGGPCRAVINVDQPLQLSGFQQLLRTFEPQLRGSTAEFEGVMTAILDQMAGPLAGHERARVSAIRRPRQDVVLGVWDLVLNGATKDLDDTVAALGKAISVPYLSLHGIDPGPGYAEWLGGLIPSVIVEIWNEQGHYPHLVAPERFTQRVRAFAQE